MKRRSKAGGAPIKGRRRKPPKPEHHNAPKTAPRSKPSPSSQGRLVARLTHELRETTEQHTATSEILRVISSSPSDLQPVFQAMLKNAVRLCDAKFGNIYRWDGDALHLVATQNVPAAFVQVRGRSPLRPSPPTPTGRMIATKTVVNVADMRAEKAYADRDPYIVAGVELGGVRTALVVPMLKDDELIGFVQCVSPRGAGLRTNRSHWCRTSPHKPLSPSRTRGCSKNCARASRWKRSPRVGEAQPAPRTACH